MKLYAVSFLSFHDNELIIDFVKTEGELRACKLFLDNKELSDYNSGETLEELNNNLFDADAVIAVKEVPLA